MLNRKLTQLSEVDQSEECKELIRLTAVLTAGWRADRIAPFIGG
ncbi:hypothetical protein [Porcincola intestinalis]|nr:hypothetical protein [Porcincola intestinalis]